MSSTFPIKNRIAAFNALGKHLQQVIDEDFSSEAIQQVLRMAKNENAWFTEKSIREAIAEIRPWLYQEHLLSWIAPYDFHTGNKTIGLIMAGNIPLVGFHDMLSILVSGNSVRGKISSKDRVLPNYISQELIKIDPRFEQVIELSEAPLKSIDAIIATGSNNSAMYFESYFGKYPNIIRKNRNSVAVLDGNESKSDLLELGKDIFSYYGLGCRNVSKLYVPANYSFNTFFETIVEFGDIIDHHKYNNNYTYNRAIYLMTREHMLDNNFLLLKKGEHLASPIGVLHYQEYEDQADLDILLESQSSNIQGIVSNSNEHLAFGELQSPKLNDYADGVNTLQFLANL